MDEEPKLTTPEAMLKRIIELLEKIEENTAPADAEAGE